MHRLARQGVRLFGGGGKRQGMCGARHRGAERAWGPPMGVSSSLSLSTGFLAGLAGAGAGLAAATLPVSIHQEEGGGPRIGGEWGEREEPSPAG